MDKKHIRIIGKLETPIISKKNYKLNDWKIAICSKSYLTDLLRPYESYSKPRFYGKNKSFLENGTESSRPFNFIAHMGFIHLDFESDNPEKDIHRICEIKQLGKFKNEGMGRIRWENYHLFEKNDFDKIKIKQRKVYLKKLNIQEIPEEMYYLLTAGLIHDLVNIPNKHPSKLGNVIINIKDKDINWLVHNHHNKINNTQLKILQRADRLASILQRKHMQPVQTQIGYGKEPLENKEIREIVGEIEKRQDNFPELYEYIYSEKRLDNFVEDQKYGLTSLRKHLLLTVHLILTT